jgi:hypothetical protein
MAEGWQGIILFFPRRKIDGFGHTQGPTFKASVPRALFQLPVAQVGHNEQALRVFGWDVAPDGKRVLVDTGTTSSEPITVVLNWTAELKTE